MKLLNLIKHLENGRHQVLNALKAGDKDKALHLAGLSAGWMDNHADTITPAKYSYPIRDVLFYTHWMSREDILKIFPMADQHGVLRAMMIAKQASKGFAFREENSETNIKLYQILPKEYLLASQACLWFLKRHIFTLDKKDYVRMQQMMHLLKGKPHD